MDTSSYDMLVRDMGSSMWCAGGRSHDRTWLQTVEIKEVPCDGCQITDAR